ncbi:hypothetical protein BU25DRAFT_490108 [Macroventuria anomochaeta]|uniref:Uncharacterized protein n=1 Tax=Macroventuria anomochaeta TaxID=301207 RepID=A0ACB6S4R2_9PLEO|nr:uncharacterized protein BU25DRAFT_490108 [Macroventuria anomochaeta]KAF2628967.1 hypothetical protein BU25DRAFT_490108 [Macroventuria anomochaeta]
MATYWTDHKHEIIVWSIVGVLLLVFLFWCFHSKPIINIQPETPALRPQQHPARDDIELASPPRAFLPAPFNPPINIMFGMDTILYIAVLYGIFLAIPLLFFILYIIFKTSECEREEIFKEGMKRKARELDWEKKNAVKSETMPMSAM